MSFSGGVGEDRLLSKVLNHALYSAVVPAGTTTELKVEALILINKVTKVKCQI